MRRSHALRPLSRGHHRLLTVAFQVKNGVQGRVVAGAPCTLDGLATLVSRFAEEDLRPHFQVEEQVLLAAWPPQGSSEEPEPARLRSDHAEILRLAAMVATSSGVDQRAALDHFAIALESHVRWEERFLFGRIERDLSTEGLAEVGAKLAQLSDFSRCAPSPSRVTATVGSEPKGGAAVSAVDLCDLHFHDSFVRALPGDASGMNVSRELRDVAYSLVNPTPVAAPRLLAWSDDLGASLGIARPVSLDGTAAQVLVGNRVLAGMRPYAARYGGHQFGVWARQLGDGRAITLGEIVTGAGERFDLQLKGAGTTPYSRRADGRAVLRSSLREFVCSEAMYHLGVPTTRALSLLGTGEPVLRDMLYDGNAKAEPGAIVCRVAPSFVRFGNFEILAAHAEQDLLKSLLDYVIATHHPAFGETGPLVYARWFEEVCRRTAVMMAHWMRVGFVHGVMNTDNMSVLGLTIDYGPYGWLEGFDPTWTPNTTDAEGRRYCFGQQPEIAMWNLSRLAEALLPLIEREALETGLDVYRNTFDQTHRQMFASKLGLDHLQDQEDETLLFDLLALLRAVETDYTIFFRQLAEVPVDHHDADIDAAMCLRPLDDAFYTAEGRLHEHQGRMLDWLRRYRHCLRKQNIAGSARRQRMRAANPKYVPRNYLAQTAIDAAEQGDTSVLERLLRVLRHPYDDQSEHDDLAARRPEWARHRVGCSALSCSS